MGGGGEGGGEGGGGEGGGEVREVEMMTTRLLTSPFRLLAIL